MTRILNDYQELLDWIKDNASVVFAVSSSLLDLVDEGRFKAQLESITDLTVFSDFEPNPKIESANRGASICKSIRPDLILAVGGGSAIDVAKVIRSEYRLKSLFAIIPTTGGSGSEATGFAAIYKDGVKLSLSGPRMAADCIMFDPKILLSMPPYQLRSTLADALCHAVESMWSRRANEESIQYAKESAKAIFDNYKAYLEGDIKAASVIQQAAYNAGRAINITTTTGGHAMSYKLTTMKGIAHGHACILAVRQLWNYMESKGIDLGLAAEFKTDFDEFYDHIGFDAPDLSEDDISVLASSVNQERLVNNPLLLDYDEIRMLYRGMTKK